LITSQNHATSVILHRKTDPELILRSNSSGTKQRSLLFFIFFTKFTERPITIHEELPSAEEKEKQPKYTRENTKVQATGLIS